MKKQISDVLLVWFVAHFYGFKSWKISFLGLWLPLNDMKCLQAVGIALWIKWLSIKWLSHKKIFATVGSPFNIIILFIDHQSFASNRRQKSNCHNLKIPRPKKVIMSKGISVETVTITCENVYCVSVKTLIWSRYKMRSSALSIN